MTLGVRCGGRWVLVRRSRKVVPEELVTLMSWDHIIATKVGNWP